MKQLKYTNKQGFTLIETLVAIFIFSTALVALATVSARGVSSVNRAKEVIIAEYLAQEGLEIVRNVRDTTTLGNGTPWDINFSMCTATSPCDITYSALVPTLALCGSGCTPLFIENGLYTATPSGPATATKFTRSITVEPQLSVPLIGTVEYAVHSRVSWTVGTGTRFVEMHTILTDWQ